MKFRREWIAATTVLLAPIPALTLAADMPDMHAMHAQHGGETQTQVAGAYRIELHVLPAEPFFTAAEVSARHITAGMLVVGGAAPVAEDASPAPNHHIIVHVFDNASGAPVTDAKVRMTYQAQDAAGKVSGKGTPVPVVNMQAIGAGPASTHYGNNLLISPGTYSLTVNVNGSITHFGIKITG